MNLNVVAIVGRLVRDPELKTLANNTQLASFTIAVDGWKKDETCFFRCSTFGKSAEFMSNYCHKGNLVSLSGRLTQRNYTDSSGNKREAIEIVAENVHNLTPRGDGFTPERATKPAATSTAEEYDPFADGDDTPVPAGFFENA